MTATIEDVSLADKLATFFREHPNVWHDGRALGTIAGAYAWRSRVSDLRKRPYHMTIQNRQRRMKTAEGKPFVLSEYCFTPPAE